jgi:hypothetical protein
MTDTDGTIERSTSFSASRRTVQRNRPSGADEQASRVSCAALGDNHSAVSNQLVSASHQDDGVFALAGTYPLKDDVPQHEGYALPHGDEGILQVGSIVRVFCKLSMITVTELLAG